MASFISRVGRLEFHWLQLRPVTRCVRLPRTPVDLAYWVSAVSRALTLAAHGRRHVGRGWHWRVAPAESSSSTVAPSPTGAGSSAGCKFGGSSLERSLGASRVPAAYA